MESSELEALLRWAAMVSISDSPSTPEPPSRTSCLGHSVAVASFLDAGGRGLAAVRDLKKGELVLRVPRSALLTRESVVEADKKLSDCIKRHPRLSSSQWIEDAKWVSEKAVSNARSEWKEAVLVMQEIDLKSQLLSFRSWLWASATISSRTLHVPWDNAGCLCPVGDLFNYAAPEEEEKYSSGPASLPECNDTKETLDAKQPDGYSLRLTDGGYEDETASYCFYAKRRYRKGEQVLLSYGTYTNLELLEHYGFLLDINPNDKAFIELDADVYRISSWPKDSLYIQPDGSPSFALLCALRLWATPAKHRKSVKHKFYTGSLLSVENELFIMKWLAQKCQQLLGRMPTTIDEDNLLLRSINTILDQPSRVEGIEACSSRELESILQVNCLVNQAPESQLSVKAKRSLERLKLAIKWRLSHKTMLLSCVSHCRLISDNLSSQH